MPPKRDFYEVLEVEKTATDDELRVAYRRLARLWHPDKNLHQSELAEENFKELRAAYEVLSDPNERAWYDAHKDDILNGGDGTSGDRSDGGDLWQYFNSSCYSGYGDDEGGFFKVYTAAFEGIIREEMREDSSGSRPPEFGTSTSSYPDHVRAFYNYWVNFSSKQSFAWKDVYNPNQAPGRDVRRIMEKENKKQRDTARKEYNELVRRIAEFARKKDPRVAQYVKEQAAMKAEAEKKAKEDKERLAASLKQHKAAAKAASEAQYDSLDLSGMDPSLLMSEKDLKRHGHLFGLGADGEEDAEDEIVEEYYCPACKKSFKSEKQYENHENSKKHKENAAKLRKELLRQEQLEESALNGKSAKASQFTSRSQATGKNEGQVDGEQVDDIDADEAQYLQTLDEIRHADDIVHVVESEDTIDADITAEEEAILSGMNLDQYLVRPTGDHHATSAPTQTQSTTDNAVAKASTPETDGSKSKQASQAEDEPEDEEGDDEDAMLSMMASAQKSRTGPKIKASTNPFSFGDSDEEGEEAPAVLDQVDADQESDEDSPAESSQKPFDFGEFEKSLSSKGSPAPKATAAVNADAGKKKRRRAVKEKKTASPVPVEAAPEPQYTRGGKGGGKGKKGRHVEEVTVPTCKTCGSTFPSNTALHTHLQQTKHAVAM